LRNAIYGFRDELISGIEDKLIEERKVKLLHQKMFGLFQAVAVIYIKSGKCKICSKEHGLCLCDQFKVLEWTKGVIRHGSYQIVPAVYQAPIEVRHAGEPSVVQFRGVLAMIIVCHIMVYREGDLCKTQRPRRTSNRGSWQM